MNALLPFWNTLIVHPIMKGLELVATPLLGMVPAGVAGALAIILFTIILRAVLLPLSLVQIRSQRAQMAIQPELKTIQRKFKGDREGLARAQMALYKERGINPAAGCLPPASPAHARRPRRRSPGSSSKRRRGARGR